MMAKRKTQKPLLRQKLIPWCYVERSSRKGYISRDEYVGNTRYNFLSAGVAVGGIMCYYMRAE